MRVFLLSFVLTFIIAPISAEAQIIDPKNEAKKEGVSRANSKINSGINKGYDKIEKGIGGLFRKKKKHVKEDPADNLNQDTTSFNENAVTPVSSSSKSTLTWNKFDFVPGDEIIFEDEPLIMEENGEFPSRWDLYKGQVEIAEFNGETVIMFLDGNPAIVPYIENASDDYLPDVFTIEFDFFRPAKGNRFFISLTDKKNQKKFDQEISINFDKIFVDANDISAKHSDKEYTMNDLDQWIHVSLAFTKGKLKIYMDDTRVINIPRYSKNPTGVTLDAYLADHANGKAFYLKNFRIAKDGVKYYDRVMTDGKIICNGIRFDSGKATLKPESMGPINRILVLLKKQPDLRFIIEGHTDTDGDNQSNIVLSYQRANTVRDQLITMGISSDRLKTKGFGESQPIDSNSTPEGKANNRRVVFVKF